MSPLSKRENQILELNALGYSAEEMADILFISRETVRKTISNIKVKLELQKATELSAYYWCLKNGTTLEAEREKAIRKIETQRQKQIRIVLAGFMAGLIFLSSTINNSDKRRGRASTRRREDIEVIHLFEF